MALIANQVKFVDLVNAVAIETVRPDMGLLSQGGDGRIPQAILGSILKLHGMDFWLRDVKFADVIFETTAFIQQLDLSVLPRYRALALARKWDPTLDSFQLNPTLLPPLTINIGGQVVSSKLALKKFEIITVTDFNDDYDVEKVDVAYLMGSNINFKSSTALAQAKIGWYQHPYLGTVDKDYEDFDSWIAQEYFFAIIYDASSNIMQKIGMTDAARKYDNPDPNNPGLVRAQVDALIRANITGVGY